MNQNLFLNCSHDSMRRASLTRPVYRNPWMQSSYDSINSFKQTDKSINHYGNYKILKGSKVPTEAQYPLTKTREYISPIKYVPMPLNFTDQRYCKGSFVSNSYSNVSPNKHKPKVVFTYGPQRMNQSVGTISPAHTDNSPSMQASNFMKTDENITQQSIKSYGRVYRIENQFTSSYDPISDNLILGSAKAMVWHREPAKEVLSSNEKFPKQSSLSTHHTQHKSKINTLSSTFLENRFGGRQTQSTMPMQNCGNKLQLIPQVPIGNRNIFLQGQKREERSKSEKEKQKIQAQMQQEINNLFGIVRTGRYDRSVVENEIAYEVIEASNSQDNAQWKIQINKLINEEGNLKQSIYCGGESLIANDAGLGLEYLGNFGRSVAKSIIPKHY